jgi:hypothetical protein
MAIHWMPLMGEFEILEGRITFKGRAIPAAPAAPGETQLPDQAAVGILLSDQKMVNGRLQAKMEFEHVEPGQTVCELVVGHDIKTKGQVTAGLGGSWVMFSIREWIPAASSPQSAAQQQSLPQWSNLELTGDRANLRAGVPYLVSARVQGSTLTLEVDNVEVRLLLSRLPRMFPARSAFSA